MAESSAGARRGDRGPAVFTVTCVLLVLSTFFVLCRLISKWGVKKRVNSDDFATILAWLFTASLSISIMYATSVGLGKYDADILPEWGLPLRRAEYAFSALYNPALMATKTAILILYIRMAQAHKDLRIASYVVLAIVNLSGIVLTFLNLFQCRPLRAAFNEYDRDNAVCIDLVSLYLSSAPINVLTDLAILLLPIPILTSLRMEFRQKLILIATFITGGFVAIVDVVRIVYLQEALKQEVALNEAQGGSQNTSSVQDFSHYVSFSLMWSAVEVNVGLICACILVLKPLVMRVMPAILHDPARRSSRSAAEPATASAQVNYEGGWSLDTFKLQSRSPRQASISQMMDPVHVEDIDSNPSMEDPSHTILEEAEGDGDGDGDDFDFFQFLASEPPEAAAPLPAGPKSPKTRERRLTMSVVEVFTRPRCLSKGENERIPTITVAETDRTSYMPSLSQGHFADFVEMNSRKSLPELTAKEAWRPVMFVSIFFALWGAVYGLLGVLNGRIQVILGYTPAQTIALHNAYWIGYFLGTGGIGYWILSRHGFKATIMSGLAIYACGAMAFWPSSVLVSFPGFVISNGMIALGLACLEVAANPFIALAGPDDLMEARLCFSQGIQGIGSVLSPILAQRVLFRRVAGRADLFNTQWCYLAVAFFVVFLAVVCNYVTLSEASDEDLALVARKRQEARPIPTGARVFGLSPAMLSAVLGIISMFLYVGGQETISYYWGTWMKVMKPGVSHEESLNYQAISHTVFALSRFLASGVAYIGVPPLLILGVSIIGSLACTIGTWATPPGAGGVAALILVTFFEAAIFPLVFAITIRGQGRHTKKVSAGLIMAISGGAVWPSIAYGINKQHPDQPRLALIVPVLMHALTLTQPMILSLSTTMRRFIGPL